MLVEMGIGDAFGSCFEWIDYDCSKIAERLEYTVVEPSLVPPGRYTDDTQMALAVVEMMLERGRSEWVPEIMADYFVNCFQRDQRRGYTPAFQMILMNCHTGQELLSKIHGNSERSGAAMRSAPIGLLPWDDLNSFCKMQAKVTHDSPVGIASALTVARSVHYFYTGGTKKEFTSWLHGQQDLLEMMDDPTTWPQPDRRVSTNGAECVKAALIAVIQSPKMTEVLKRSVNFGGDTDTIATIAMGIASQCPEIENDIPYGLIEHLEHGTYGYDYLKNVDAVLMQFAKEMSACNP